MRLLKPRWPAPANVHAFTTTRPTPADEDILATLPAAVSMVSLQQVHGVHVVDSGAGEPGAGVHLAGAADACISRRALRACRVVTADCLPLLLCNRGGTEVAAVHAGWRGLAAGVVENTLAALQSAPAELLVWLGPAISQAHFEVGADVLDAFLAGAPASRQQQTRACFRAVDGNKYMADLYGLARSRLEFAGVEHIFGADYCTFAQPDLLHSYRRQGGDARMSSVIYFS